MSELIAWGDESVQTQGGVIPTYYMGACICGLGERDIRSCFPRPSEKSPSCIGVI